MKKRNFKKLSNVEHVRLRTGMWLGQNSLSLFDQHFFLEQKDGSYRIEHEEIEELPAKLKCLDEACMNSIDEYNRNFKDSSIPLRHKMKTLVVTLSHNRTRITVEDDGRGIPAKNAEQVFLHLMYGENFDDELQKEHVAGQNGVGISLVRIVSSYFHVETKNKGKCFRKLFTLSEKFIQMMDQLKVSERDQKLINQYFDEHGSLSGLIGIDATVLRKLNQVSKKDNMLGKVSEVDKTDHGTKIDFELNPLYFNGLDIKFTSKLLYQYLQDLAMTNPGLSVVFREKTSRANSKGEKDKEKIFYFKKGMEDIFRHSKIPYYKLVYYNPKNNLELISFVLGESGKTLSWINSNFASLGGSSIEFYTNLICDEIRKKPAIVSYEKKFKTVSTRNDVRNCLHFYNNLHLIAPRFKSQDKSYLINDLKEDIRKAVLQHLDKLIRKLDLINRVKEEIRRRSQLRDLTEAQKELKKANRSVIPKFIPCTSRLKEVVKTLFIGEGDSAIAGLRQVRDPAIHALFPLRGKPLNVRELALSKAMQNEELKNIISILELPFNQEVDVETLSFERISIITDADYDGYAIRSLMFNFFFEYWPQLYEKGVIYLTEAPLYEVILENPKKEKKTFYCTDDEEYSVLMEKAKKNSCKLVRKKRNKGLGETSQQALAFALENGMKKISIGEMKLARKVQNLWFHKNEAAQRRKEISSYKQLFLQD